MTPKEKEKAMESMIFWWRTGIQDQLMGYCNSLAF
jgi:hypothetical protein